MVFLENATLLPLTDEILELTRQLIRSRAFPQKAVADAIHVAAATAYGCEYLLTWNFKHINNARLKRDSARIIEEFGYEPTTICTPDELMGSDE